MIGKGIRAGGLLGCPVLTGIAKVGRVDFDELGIPGDGVVHDSGRVVGNTEVMPQRGEKVPTGHQSLTGVA